MKTFSIKNGKRKRNKVVQAIKFINPEELLYEVEQYLTKQETIDLVELRTSQETQKLFWNLIYYFNEYELCIEFLLPYAEEQELTKSTQEIDMEESDKIIKKTVSQIHLTKITSLQEMKRQ